MPRLRDVRSKPLGLGQQFLIAERGLGSADFRNKVGISKRDLRELACGRIKDLFWQDLCTGRK